ncbi:MAG TPA: hypothetical protein DEO32_03690 [Ruminococcaceae bacterium]|nr:hypothetical protein [Oscillospiraceae bacterium]
MNGGDKIIERIKADSKKTVDEIMARASDECAAIMQQAEKTADKNAAEISSKTAAKLKQIEASSKSRAELETRNALLKQRRNEIDKTVEALGNYLLNLGDNEYFDALYRLAAQLKGKSGTVYLNQKDLNRLPSDFESKIGERGLNADVSKTPIDISGGFVLKSGDVEENMDINALIGSRRDEIEDLINRELFAR